MTPEERIAELEAEIAGLRAQIQELVAQNQQLQARLANATKDSHNSSKPPSSDPLGRKRPRSQRRKSGKKPGGQLGHRGETLRLVATPDEVVEHRPAVCTECQMPLDQTASVVLCERRQVRDLPVVRLLVREHRAVHVRCTCAAPVASRSVWGRSRPRRRVGRNMGRACGRWGCICSNSSSSPMRACANFSPICWGRPSRWARWCAGHAGALGAAGRGDAAARRGGDQGGACARASAP